ncbi:MAG TPA: glycosyltransferase family 2 protein [Bacteroidia bacterium]|nr:glycosyltransferase family 2 protein [Bacteroidia bacterium]
MKLSLITINFNDLEGLKKTLESAGAQTYRAFEHIVIDGGSEDGSAAYLQNNSDGLAYWVSEKDGGIYDAMNKGLKQAKGDYLLFLNSGDILYDKNTLEKALPHLDGTSFCYGDLILIRNEQREEHRAPESIDLDFMLNSTFWHPCVFIASSQFKQHGLYRTEFKIAGDYEFFIRCLLKPGTSTKHIPHFIAVFNAEGRSNDPAFQRLQTEEREKSWTLNLSGLVFSALKAYNRFTRSRFSVWYKRLQHFRTKGGTE